MFLDRSYAMRSIRGFWSGAARQVAGESNPTAKQRNVALRTILAISAAGLWGFASFPHQASAAIAPGTAGDINPVAKKRPGKRVAELCTIDAVPERGSRGSGGFSFTGPAHFTDDGRMTCHRAKLTLRFRKGYRDIHTRKCSGGRYIFGALKKGKRYLIYFNAFSGRIVKTRRVK